MVEELAVNAVEKKLDMQASILVGNYEYYYACGKLKGMMDLAVDEETAPLVMKEIVDEALASFTPDEAAEPVKAYLKTLLLRYRPADEYDAQMADLFRWGRDGH